MVACPIDGDRGVDPARRRVTPPAAPGPGVSSGFAPALSFVGDELVLAHAAPGGVTIQKSGDGVTWTAPPGVVATAGGAPISTIDAPYLNNTFGQLWLATTLDRAVGTSTAIDVFLFGSTDGLAWAQQSRFTTGAGFSAEATAA